MNPKWSRCMYIYSPRNHFTLWISINHSYKIIFYKLINCSCIKEVCNIQFNKNIDAILYIYIYIFQNYQTSHYKNTFRMASYYYNVYSYFFFIHFHSSNHFYATIGCDNRIYKSIHRRYFPPQTCSNNKRYIKKERKSWKYIISIIFRSISTYGTGNKRNRVKRLQPI